MLLTNGSQKLPSVPDEITASWLGSVLGHQVKSVDITKSILNATASKIPVTITYENGDDASASRPKHVCLKDGFNPVMLAMEGYGDILKLMYSREVKFFGLVAPKLTNIMVPRAWWAGENEAHGQAIVIMDDLNHGFTFGDPVFTWPVGRVMAGVEELAALHAGTWNASVSGEQSWLTPAYEHVMIELTLSWDAMVFGEGRPPIPADIRNRGRTVAAMKKHFATKNPQVYLHTARNGRPYFLDWQTNHIGSAFHDVTYFVVGALSVEDRRAHEVAILDHYLETLAKFGGPTLSSQDPELMKEYKKSAMSGMGWILTPFEMQVKERVFVMCERYCTAMMD